MGTAGKFFRYSHIFKHLWVLYFLFLGIVGLLSYFARDAVILTVLGLTVFFGLLLFTVYRTFSTEVSEHGITQKTLFSTKSLAWADIRQISVRGSSLRLRGEHASISVSPRQCGAMQITQWLQTRRPGLFRTKHVARLERNNTKTVPMLLIGILLILLSLLLYVFKNYLFMPGFLGLFFCAQAIFAWYVAPRSMTVENDCLTVQYRNGSVKYSADDIESIQALMTDQGQYQSVVIVFRDQKTLDLSVFRQTPFITFPVLSQWHEQNTQTQADV